MRPRAHTAWPTQELKKQSEWLGGRGGHEAEHTPPSPGAAGEPGRPARVPRTPPQSPFLCCGDLRNPKPREPPAPGAGTKGCSPRGSLRLFFRGCVCVCGGKMAGPGKQRKLGPGPGSGVCGSRVRPGSCVGVAGRLCQPARSRLGETQSSTPAAGGALPPTCRGPAAPGSPGRRRREGAPGSPPGEGAGRAGRRPAGARGGAVAAEEGSAGGRAASRHGYCGCPGI